MPVDRSKNSTEQQLDFLEAILQAIQGQSSAVAVGGNGTSPKYKIETITLADTVAHDFGKDVLVIGSFNPDAITANDVDGNRRLITLSDLENSIARRKTFNQPTFITRQVKDIPFSGTKDETTFAGNILRPENPDDAVYQSLANGSNDGNINRQNPQMEDDFYMMPVEMWDISFSVAKFQNWVNDTGGTKILVYIYLDNSNIEYDYFIQSNPDANGNYQTIVYKTGGAGGTTLYTVTLTFDDEGNTLTYTKTTA